MTLYSRRVLLLANADVHAPAALGVRHVLVAAERVVHVTDPGQGEPQLDPGLGVRRLDLDGRRLVPGLLDGHVHVTGGGGEAGPESAVAALPVTAYLDAGVTTVVGLLGTDDEIRTTASVLARVRALRAEGISAWCLTGGYHLPPTTLTGSVRGDIVHLDPVIGVGEVAISDHRSSHPDAATLARLAADAHVAGMLTGKAGVVHFHVGADGDQLAPLRRVLRGWPVPAANLHPTHVNRHAALLDDARTLADEDGVVVDITAAPVGEDDGTVPAHRALAGWLDDGPADRVTVSSDSGGSLPSFDADGRVTGQDVGTPATLTDTLAALLAEGRAPAQVLPPFTSTPATVWQLPRKGHIAEGADADLLVLGEDHRPAHVIARGRLMVSEGKAVTHGGAPGTEG